MTAIQSFLAKRWCGTFGRGVFVRLWLLLVLLAAITGVASSRDIEGGFLSVTAYGAVCGWLYTRKRSEGPPSRRQLMGTMFLIGILTVGAWLAIWNRHDSRYSFWASWFWLLAVCSPGLCFASLISGWSSLSRGIRRLFLVLFAIHGFLLPGVQPALQTTGGIVFWCCLVGLGYWILVRSALSGLMPFAVGLTFFLANLLTRFGPSNACNIPRPVILGWFHEAMRAPIRSLEVLLCATVLAALVAFTSEYFRSTAARWLRRLNVAFLALVVVEVSVGGFVSWQTHRSERVLTERGFRVGTQATHPWTLRWYINGFYSLETYLRTSERITHIEFESRELLEHPTDEDLELLASHARHAVKSLYLKGDGITDRGLIAVRRFPNLTDLSLRSTRVTAAGLRELPVAKLVCLRVSQNPQMNHLTWDARRFAALEVLELEGPSVSDADLKGLKTLPKLKWLTISNAAITDESLREIGAISGIRHLRLTDNSQLIGKGLMHLAESRTQELNLSGCPICDDGLKALPELLTLRFLNLERTQLSDAGLAEVARQRNLDIVFIHGTPTTSSGIHDLAEKCPQLKIKTTPREKHF